MVVIVAEAAAKETKSRLGMEHTRLTSPYYPTWVKQAEIDYREMISAVGNENFSEIGELAEANALAMHSGMMSARPSLLYWNSVTMSIIGAVWQWRSTGIAQTYFTIDAGPNVIVICKKEDIKAIAEQARRISGVKQVIPSLPGGPAEVVFKE